MNILLVRLGSLQDEPKVKTAPPVHDILANKGLIKSWKKNHNQKQPPSPHPTHSPPYKKDNNKKIF